MGDTFYIKVLDETLCYTVDQILTVLPHEMDALMIQPGKDYVTLVTCTPYGISSHRLLVRGVRTPYEPQQYQQAQAEAATVSFWQGLPAQYRHMLIGAEVLAIILLVRVILHLIQNMGKRGKRPHDG